MKPTRRPTGGLPKAAPLRRKPSPKAFDLLRQMAKLVNVLRAGMSEADRKRCRWTTS